MKLKTEHVRRNCASAFLTIIQFHYRDLDGLFLSLTSYRNPLTTKLLWLRKMNSNFLVRQGTTYTKRVDVDAIVVQSLFLIISSTAPYPKRNYFLPPFVNINIEYW